MSNHERPPRLPPEEPRCTGCRCTGWCDPFPAHTDCRERDELLNALSELVRRYECDGVPNDSLPVYSVARELVERLTPGAP